jgi:hypothetical protein
MNEFFWVKEHSRVNERINCKDYQRKQRINMLKFLKRKVDDIAEAPTETSPKKLKIDNVARVSDQLDLTSLETVISIEQRMRQMADYLMNNVALFINGGKLRCRIAEIEFYLTTKDTSHKDPFSHCHPLQLRKGQWYFHQSTDKINDQNYRESTYKGLDITFGSDTTHYGGILIRSLEELNLKNDTRKSFVDGPSLCVDFIITKAGANSIHDLVHKFPSETLSVDFPSEGYEKYPIYLAPCTFEKKLPLYKSTRVGLSLRQITEQEARVKYIMRPYRFFIQPTQTKKGKNQMAASMYIMELKKMRKEKGANYMLSVREKGQTIATICDKLGCQIKTATRYVELVETGMRSPVTVTQDRVDLNNVREYMRRDLTPEDVVRLHGVLFEFI